MENKIVDPTERWLDFSDAWKSAGGKNSPSPIYINLLERYSEPHRHYHNLSHINHCLDELKISGHLAININAVRMAIWFHDAIYDIKAKDNEERSAELARTILKNASLPNKFIELVINLILATKHTIPLTNHDAKLITDIDLSSLGAPDEIFDENGRQIRKEYDWVPENLFNEGRAKFLKLLLEPSRIYSTWFFYNR
ncbi:MAG: N-methyl-D-aspartate receptor NMDAR2C subunit, partial [bacterium]|nr:N-methyl-D-aspartate receptor NMDAR2C subunit [bacterium]